MATFPKFKEMKPAPYQVEQLPQIPQLPVVGFPTIKVGYVRPPQELEHPWFDYNDPNQINSFKDVIYKQINRIRDADTLIDKIGANLSAAPLALADTIKLTLDSLSPAMRGDFGGVGINMLINFAETLDIVATPAKGLLMDGPGGVDQALRGKNYDWNTGNIVQDIALEVVSDPLNLLSFGGKALAKQVGMGAVQAAIKESGLEASEKNLKYLSKQLIQNYSGDWSDTVLQTFKHRLATTMFADPTNHAALRVLQNMTLDKTTLQVIKGVNRIADTADKADSALFKIALYTGTAGTAFGHRLITKSPVAHYVANQLTGIITKYDPHKEVNLISYVQSLPELTLKIETMKQLDETLDIGEFATLIGRKAILSDLQMFRMLIAGTDSGPSFIKQLDQTLEAMGHTFDEYDGIVNRLAGLDVDLQHVDRFLNLWNDIKTIREAHSQLLDAGPLYVKAKEAVDTFVKLIDDIESQDVYMKLFKEAPQKIADNFKARIKGGQPVEVAIKDANRIIYNLGLELGEKSRLLLDVLTARGTISPARLGEIAEANDAKIKNMLSELYAFSDKLAKFMSKQKANKSFDLVRLEEQFKTAQSNIDNLSARLLSTANLFYRSDNFPEKANAIHVLLENLKANPELDKTLELSETLLQRLKDANIDITNPNILLNSADAREIVRDTLTGVYDTIAHYIESIDTASTRHIIFEKLQQQHTSDIAGLLEIGIQKGFIQKGSIQFKDFKDTTAEQWESLIETLYNMQSDLTSVLQSVEFPDVYVRMFKESSERAEELLANMRAMMRTNGVADGWKFSPEDLESAFDELDNVMDGLRNWLLDPMHHTKMTLHNGNTIQTVDIILNKVMDASDQLRDALLVMKGVTLEGNKLMSFKSSQMQAMFQLLSIQDVATAADDIQTMGQLYTALHSIRSKFVAAHDESMIPVLSTILSKLNGVGTTMDFMQNILGSNLPEHVKVGFIDSIQRVANASLHKFVNDPKYNARMLKQLLDKTEAHINAGAINRRHTLKAVSVTESAEIEAWATEQGPEILDIIKNNRSHEAIRDIVVNKYLFEKLGGKVPAGKKGMFLDIETTGTGTGDSMLELAYWIEGEKPVSVKIKPNDGMYPDEHVIRVLLGLPDEVKYSKGELYDMFDKQYKDGISEHAALEHLQDALRKSDIDGKLTDQYRKNMVLIGHNLDNFDVKFISKRRTLQNFQDYFRFETMDTLPMLRESTKYYALSDSDTKQLAEMYRKYLRDKDIELYNIKESFDRARSTIPQGANYDGQKFLETPDRALQDAIARLDQYTAESTKGNIHITKDEEGALLLLRNIQKDLGDTLKGIKGNNKLYSRYYMSIDSLDEMFGELAKGMDLGDSKFSEVMNLNITSAISNKNVSEYIDPVTGKVSDVTTGYQEMAAKTVTDINLAKTFFNGPALDDAAKAGKTGYLNKLHRASKELNFLRDQVHYFDVVKPLHPELLRVSRDMLNALKGYTGLTNIDVLLKDFEINQQDLRTLFAQTLYLYRRFDTIKSLQRTVLISPELKGYLNDPMKLAVDWDEPKAEVIEDFFQLSDLIDVFEATENFTRQTGLVEPLNDVDMLSQIDALLEVNNLNAPKELTKKAVLQPLQNLNIFVQKLVDSAILKGEVSGSSSVFRGAIVERMLDFDHQITDSIYNQLTNFTVGDWESHLAHNAYGIWYTSKADLIQSFERGGKTAAHASAWLTQLMKDAPKEKFAFDAMGDGIFIGLRKEVDISKVPRPKRMIDIQLQDKGKIVTSHMVGEKEQPETLLTNAQSKQLTEHMNNVRKELLTHAPSGNGSNMEIVTKSAMYSMLDNVPDKLKGMIHSIDDFGSLRKFEGFNFNHSAVGYSSTTAHTGRKAMFSFFSANPLKNYAVAAQDLAGKMSVQAKYVTLMRDPSLLLNGDMLKFKKNAEIFEMLKDRRDYKVGFLQSDTKMGYKLKTVVLKSEKDVEFARSVNAVILPVQVFNKAVGVINDYRVTNTLAKTLEKYVVGPTKLGAIASPGMVMRNIIDSSTKTLIHAETLEIVSHFVQTAAHYIEYSRIIKDVIDKYGHLTKDNLHIYFRDHQVGMNRAYFDLIDEFIQDGASAGQTAHVQKYLGDMTKTLHRKIRDNLTENIDETTLHNFLNGSEVFREPSQYSPQVYEELTRLRAEGEYIKQAIGMRGFTREREFGLDGIIRYLKQPETIPPHLLKEWNKIYKHRNDLAKNDLLAKAIYNNYYTHALLGANGWFEQVMRLTQYTYDVSVKGASKSSAMADVIKTHFDYSHRTLAQQYVEWVLPFSTFAFNNLQFWADVAETKPWVYGIVRDFMSPIVDLGQHDSEEIQRNQSLQAQIQNGNLILDNETGFNLKLNPSVFDSLKLMTNPYKELTARLAPYIKNPFELASGKNYWGDKQSDEDKRNLIIGMTPLVGPAIIRSIAGTNAAKDTGNPLNAVVPSIFGRTKQKLEQNGFGQRAVYEPFAKTAQYKKYAQQKYSKKYLPTARKVFPGSVAPFNNIKYNRLTDFTGYTSVYRKMTTKKTLRNDLFTAKGRMRLQLMMIKPKTGDAGHRLSNILRMW